VSLRLCQTAIALHATVEETRIQSAKHLPRNVSAPVNMQNKCQISRSNEAKPLHAMQKAKSVATQLQ
jgi:hypothetical protein